VQPPETRYAVRGDGVSIAYQVLGEGPIALIFCFGWISHLDLQWSNPDITRFLTRLASFSRLVLYDKAGTGLSDPIAHLATLEERAEDIRTVLDAAGVQRAALFGESEGGPSAMLFAATHPERTSALILYGSVAKTRLTDDDCARAGIAPGAWERVIQDLGEAVQQWGRGLTFSLLAPSGVDSAIARRGAGTYERASVSPSMARALLDALADMDVTTVAHTVSVPTLILHRREDAIPAGMSRLLAHAIPQAQLIELEGVDHAYFVNGDQIIDEVERFLTGGVHAEQRNRVLTTILFTDIVDSTRRAADVGDAAWRRLLERHDAIARERAEAAGGRVVKSLGDGALAALPGPARAIRCAQEIISETAELGLQLRAGVHTGECEVLADDLGGLTVHIGARVSALAGAGEVLVSGAVKDLVVGSTLRFIQRGEHELKGVPGRWRVYAVAEDAGATPPALAPAAEHMTAGDRMTVRLARHSPGLLRALARLASVARPRIRATKATNLAHDDSP
jgi:class 3 adenylate cyclase